ncbi:MAG TPA: hypothetical protein VFO83_02175 [Aggregicoccus sp.]|nr:hypothetical protein [Aggregicoccus sp.]
MQSLLERYLPHPRLRELHTVDVGASPGEAYAALRRFDLASLPAARVLFALRELPDRLRGHQPAPGALRLERIGTQPAPGFRVLEERPGQAFAVGAVGRFWRLRIPFVDFSPEHFREVGGPGLGKVAWEARCEPRGPHVTRVAVEVRVTAADARSWAAFRRYFLLVGPFSRRIRRATLARLARQLGTPEQAEQRRALPGDERVPHPRGQVTQGITVRAPPAAIWPWLVQMGRGRAGWYALDLLDNDGVPSARELLPEAQELKVGDFLPASPARDAGFLVERVEPPHVLVLGGCFDLDAGRQVLPGEPRPARYLDVGWAFVLERLSPRETRVLARARADFPAAGAWRRALWMHLTHRVMQRTQLRRLARRAEGRPVHTPRDVLAGAAAALRMVALGLTPFLRPLRSHHGLTREEAARPFPGDERVPRPRWGWTHAVEVEAPAEAVWPWVAQLGQGRAGFYSYQWLENLAGCRLQNASAVHPDWQLRPGDALRLHPDAPPLPVVDLLPGRYFVVHLATDPVTGEPPRARRYLSVSWLFLVEPRGPGRSRVVSRYRVDYAGHLPTRLLFGPWAVEPVATVMDLGMLRGLRRRAQAPSPRAWSLPQALEARPASP